ncbi:restriction endonuclease subunit S [Aeromonas allosaccharophila]|uniref:restriction endonuclease subunit S n=1 Tax=Aeromonas allosaccharophila TaxID=656 RepID=UPI001116AA8F|nr:restriction endonuclease subunit S [Aeromonas allosaccharophila]TNI84562.1 hypothetical protein CF120_20945 [Aeromonas allosaccharophila]
MAEQMMQEAAGKAIPAGYKQTEAGVIPEDWEQVALGHIAEVRMCKRIFSDQTTESGAIPFFKIGTFGGQPDAYISISRYNEFKAKYSFPEKGDVLISAAGTLGKTVVYDGAPAYFQDSNIVWLEVNKNKILNEYLRHYYKVISWASPEGSTISRLYNAIIRATVINLPSLPEQTAIANVLSDSDALIDALEKLIAKKQAIKTATMQQLLTGRTRLPQFALRPDGTTKGYKTSELGQIPEDWITPTLKDITSNIIDYRGRTPRKLGLEWGGGNILALSAGNVKKGFIDYEAECYFGSDELYKKWMASGDASKGDIVFTMEAPLGNVALIPNEDKYILSQRTILLQLERSKFLPTFIIQVFLSDMFQSYISESATGSTAQGIKRATFEKMFVAVPSCLEEQTAIATILSDMDSELTALEQKLAKARDLKQGMMQQLLTGRIRLPLEVQA